MKSETPAAQVLSLNDESIRAAWFESVGLEDSIQPTRLNGPLKNSGRQECPPHLTPFFSNERAPGIPMGRMGAAAVQLPRLQSPSDQKARGEAGERDDFGTFARIFPQIA
jgi:hypothetical protein